MFELGADFRKGLAPTDGHVFIARGVVPHRMSQPTLFFQGVIGPLAQFSECMISEEFRCGCLGGYLPRGGLGAVFTELEVVRRRAA